MIPDRLNENFYATVRIQEIFSSTVQEEIQDQVSSLLLAITRQTENHFRQGSRSSVQSFR